MKHLLVLLMLATQPVFSQQLRLTLIPPATDASFRGLSVVDDSVAWVSGSKGWVGRSTDGGNTWKFAKVKGYEKCDFRSLYAFNAHTAVIANAGAPAYMLRTTDGGLTWTETYRNDDSAAFFDGLDFWDNKAGIIYGDPIGGRMLLLTTNDGGITWQEIQKLSRPALAEGEASFAASGTNIRHLQNKTTVIATGGKVSRLLISADKGHSWNEIKTPILQGQSSTGIFSFAFLNEKTAIIVGGDYKADSLKKDHVFYTKDKGKSWIAPRATTRGYRECVEFINSGTVIATGPGGTDVSYNAGVDWQPLSDEKAFHVVRKSRKGNLVIIAGGTGKIGLIN